MIIDGMEIHGSIKERKCEHCSKVTELFSLRDYAYNLSSNLCKRCLYLLHDVDDDLRKKLLEVKK